MGRQSLLLLVCLAALTGSVAGKRCRDKKSAKGCVKKRTKNLCNVEAACPKPKKSGKKCTKTRKSCRLTCGLCVPGVDPTTNQATNDNYEPPVNTALASMLTTCGCTPAVVSANGQTTVAGGWDVSTGVAPAYFCVKTEYKEEVAVNICNAPGGSALNVAASCPGGMRACGSAGYPPPPPSPSPRSPPPPPSPPAQPPPSLPPSVPPSMPCVPIGDRSGLLDRLSLWCVDKDPSVTCAPSTWDTSLVTDMENIIGVSSCVNALWGESEFEDMNAWDVSQVTNMEGMFMGATTFDQPLNAWDVSKVTGMQDIFGGATAFDQPLNAWDVSQVTNMERMFGGAIAFNQPLNAWDVSKVASMQDMFYDATAFDQAIGSWDVSKVTNMQGMFYGATAFDQAIGSWDVSKVATMESMFTGATAFSQNINDWDVDPDVVLVEMFNGTTAFNQPLNAWVLTSGPPGDMFTGATAFDVAYSPP